MCYIALVAIVNRLDNLSPQEFRLELRHLSIWFHLEITVQAAPIHELHDEKHLFRRLKYLKELCNVLMVELLHDFHLAFDTLSSVGLHQFGLLVDLHGYLLVERPVQAQSHDSVGPLANPLADKVAV